MKQILLLDNLLGNVVLVKALADKCDLSLKFVAHKDASKQSPAKMDELWIEEIFPGKISELALDICVSEKTKRGRIAVAMERKNYTEIKISETCLEKYQPKDTKRAGELSIKGFSHQILVELANEGMADSVEFRRLARKFIREIKNANCDTVLWNDAILGEKKAAKILQKICGSQLKCVFMTEICTNKVFIKNFEEKFPGKKTIKIEVFNDEFTKKRLESILSCKLKENWID
jgi:hypothetical protein